LLSKCNLHRYIVDTSATSAKPTCAMVRLGEPPTLDYAIIALQRLLANRYAMKSKYKVGLYKGCGSS
jgi:hypothetical protein